MYSVLHSTNKGWNYQLPKLKYKFQWHPKTTGLPSNLKDNDSKLTCEDVLKFWAHPKKMSYYE